VLDEALLSNLADMLLSASPRELAQHRLLLEKMLLEQIRSRHSILSRAQLEAIEAEVQDNMKDYHLEFEH
jgi:hypothetical protein